MGCKGIVEPERMPPTKRSAYFHGLRPHQQIIHERCLMIALKCGRLGMDVSRERADTNQDGHASST